MIQVYTGSGKGKTTAALGLALRAAGANLKVYFTQFVKGRYCSELKALKKIKNITVEQFGCCRFIKGAVDNKDIAMAKRGLKKVHLALESNRYDIIILDEINVALSLKLLDTNDVLKLLLKSPKHIELILTGRSAPKEIIKSADLVSEIIEVKHYFKEGIKARKGIEL